MVPKTNECFKAANPNHYHVRHNGSWDGLQCLAIGLQCLAIQRGQGAALALLGRSVAIQRGQGEALAFLGKSVANLKFKLLVVSENHSCRHAITEHIAPPSHPTIIQSHLIPR